MSTQETRQVFEQLLKKAERKTGKEKSKKATEKEIHIVENLERSLTKDDPLLENNTYNGEIEKNLKNLRNNSEIKGKENEADYIDGVEKEAPKKLARGKKKTKTKNADAESGSNLVVDDTKPVKKPRSPKKKKTAGSPGDDVHGSDIATAPVPTPRKIFEEQQGEDAVEENAAEQETIPKTTQRKKRRTKKRGTPRALPTSGATQEVLEAEADQDASPQEVSSQAADSMAQELAVDAPPHEPTFQDDGTILGVTVHYCDHLRADLRYVAHPLVKVSIVDTLTGKYLEKFDSSRHVSSFYENENVSCILPLMTQPFDFKTNRSILPRWEEPLVFNEPFRRLTHVSSDPTKPKPVLFFVIRDFVTMAKVNNKRGGSDKGWHNIAWGFLKLVSSRGEPNAGRKMRLQLFYPPRVGNIVQDANSEPAYNWWLNHSRQRYPATLYVTIKAVLPPRKIDASARSMFAMQPEEGELSFNELHQSLEQSESEARSRAEEEDDLASMQLWSRLPSQTCKVPNTPFLRFWAGSEGAFTLQFSHRGTRLAAACRHEATYPIFLYGIPTGEDMGVITGHQQLVYDLQWSKNDRYLLSASADGTAQVWDMECKEKPIHTLPHPCYVYTASFHTVAQHLIATGGYDTIVRVWNTASVNSQLTQEMGGHKAIINAILFDQTGLNMFSGDGAGVIICWNCQAYEKAKKNIKTNWSVKVKIEDRDLAGICINSLRLHPQNNKILIHCRDSTVRILDTRIHSMKRFSGLVNHRQLLRSSLTPCGTFIFSGSEDGCVYVWNVDTGDQVAIYNELGYTSAVHAVVYHPHDHMVAFCSYAPNQSILLYKFNSAVATMEAGFQPNAEPNSMSSKEAGPVGLNAQIEASKANVKLESIKHRLDSVLAESLNISSGNTVLPPQPRSVDGQIIIPIKSPRSPGQGSYMPMSTWGSTFDSTTQVGTLLAPSYLSPHASPEARAMARQYASTGQANLDHSGSWRPGIATVGGSPYRPQSSGIPPDVSFSVDKDGKQKLNVTSTPGSEAQCVVVALFDYQANRSDELTVTRGDVIRVMYKDSANWWFGQKTSDGAQGYFPSNYVEEQVSTAKLQQADCQASLFGVPESSSPKKVHALKMPSGRLQFYSQSESEGDEERLSNASTSSRQRRRETKLEKVRNIPSLGLNISSLTQSSEATQPKSILQKSSPRAKITVPTPSSEGANIKEVSFADDKKKPGNTKSKQKLIDSIHDTMKASGIENLAETSQGVTPSPRALPKPKAVSRSASLRRGVEETSFGGSKSNQGATPISQSTPDVIGPTPTPSFGILKSVQALMKDRNNESTFSQSVLGGHDYPVTPKLDQDKFRAPIHSTAMKKSRAPVENDESPGKSPHGMGSVVKKARGLPKIRRYPDEEAIPMVEVKGRGSPSGVSNPAFDTST